jgi:hypothetical protein
MALFRPDQLASRYFYPAGVLIIVTLVELAAGYLPRRPTRRAIAVAIVAVSVVLFGQVASFLYGGKFLRDWAPFVRTSIGALELARDHVEPSFRPDPVRAPNIDAAGYFDVTDDYGSPADSPAEIVRLREDARENADSVLSAALRLRVDPMQRPESPGPTPTVGIRKGGLARPSAGCLLFEPRVARSYIEVSVPRAGLWLRPHRGANGELRLRRFGSTYPAQDEPPAEAAFATYVFPGDREFIKPTVLRPPDESGSALVIPSDRASNIPWHAHLTTDRPVEICSRAA